MQIPRYLAKRALNTRKRDTVYWTCQQFNGKLDFLCCVNCPTARAVEQKRIPRFSPPSLYYNHCTWRYFTLPDVLAVRGSWYKVKGFPFPHMNYCLLVGRALQCSYIVPIRHSTPSSKVTTTPPTAYFSTCICHSSGWLPFSGIPVHKLRK